MSETLRWIIYVIFILLSNIGTFFISQRIYVKRIGKGVQVLLKIELERISNRCHRKGYATLDEKNEYEYIYTIYKTIAKDGVMEINHNQLMELPSNKK